MTAVRCPAVKVVCSSNSGRVPTLSSIIFTFQVADMYPAFRPSIDRSSIGGSHRSLLQKHLGVSGIKFIKGEWVRGVDEEAIEEGTEMAVNIGGDVNVLQREQWLMLAQLGRLREAEPGRR